MAAPEGDGAPLGLVEEDEEAQERLFEGASWEGQGGDVLLAVRF